MTFQCSILLGFNELHEHCRSRCERRAVPAHAHAYAKRDKDVRLASAGRTAKNQIAVFLNERAVEMLQDFCFWKLRLQAEIKSLNRLGRWKVRGGNTRAHAVFL